MTMTPAQVEYYAQILELLADLQDNFTSLRLKQNQMSLYLSDIVMPKIVVLEETVEALRLLTETK